MLRTYKAVLIGNRIEWQDTPPDSSIENQPVSVHVTILDESAKSQSGRVMANILEQLAAIKALNVIEDPSQWERDIRQDRALPEREA